MNKKHIHTLLISFLAFIFLLVLFRFFYTNSNAYFFLIWNLFLAYIPFFISYQIVQLGKKNKAEIIFCGLIWLLFLPNGGYIITDFFHLGQNKMMPEWYDVALLFCSSLVGLLMGVISIIWMQEYLQNKFTKPKMRFAIFSICLLSGFGIYLGRYLRWNSWDIISNPMAIWQESFYLLLHPLAHPKMMGITILFAAMQLFCVWFLQLWQKAEM
jgi:uncharacterized membrane protein